MWDTNEPRFYYFFLRTQVSNIAMLRDHRAQLRDLKATANKSGRENVDPGSSTGADEIHPSARSINLGCLFVLYSPMRIFYVIFSFHS